MEAFQGNKSVYEQLRTLLEADEKVKEIAPWGFRTFESPVVFKPPTPELSVARYEEYLALLTQAKAGAASRSEGPQPRVCIAVWASGWAADTQHIAVCSLPDEPKLDAVVGGGSPAERSGVKYTHIDGHWYLQKAR